IDFYFDELGDRFLGWVIDNYPERFTEVELEEMRAQADSHLDIYEVLDVFPGKGSYIKSLFTKDEGFLKDISSSFGLVKWDIFLTRCYFFQGNYYATGECSRFSLAEKEFIINRMNKARSDYSSLFADTDYAMFAKNNWDIFYQIEREINERIRNKKVYTNYGEFQPCEVHFKVNNIQNILVKIKSLDEFNFIGTSAAKRGQKKTKKIMRFEFDWTTQGIQSELDSIKTGEPEDGLMLATHQLDDTGNKTGIEGIGNLYVDKLKFRLKTNSLELAEFARRHFTDVFGETITFKRIQKLNYNIHSRNTVDEISKEQEMPTQNELELIQEIGEKYYLSLLDQEVPALNNMSPREASKDPATRPLLIDWLKGLENHLERERRNKGLDISMQKIIKELGITW
ncbi:hypothetical protein JXB12_09275, partial [candidate division KSB1 bacterium]|nr:hypothetical protein [candidate division KSB1 bacterium]